VGGHPLEIGILRDADLVVAPGGRFRQRGPGGELTGLFVLDPTLDPAALDLVFLGGPQALKPYRGVYRVEGDTYTVSMGVPGRPRPDVLGSPEGSSHAFQVMKRKPAAP
jgi:uncharacterized protein (TIGR03067 family)